MIDVKVIVALAGLALGVLPPSVAVGGCSEPAPGHQRDGQKSQVVVSVTRDATGQLQVSVQGPPAMSIRVEAPPDVKVIGVGGDGAAGMPGASGR